MMLKPNENSHVKMSESSLCLLEDPWDSPSVMSITPPPVKRKLNEKIPPGSTELQRVMVEMNEELEVERRIRMFQSFCEESETEKHNLRKDYVEGNKSYVVGNKSFHKTCPENHAEHQMLTSRIPVRTGIKPRQDLKTK